MALEIKALVVLGLFVAISAKNNYDPMVAFICDRGSMHMDPEKGWHSDPTTNCIENKDNILQYCKTVYPSLDVTNIVETFEYVDVKGWCPLGEIDCASPESFKVRPYRCLTGPFQSDALVVPKQCIFDHVHDTDQCQTYDWWGDVATKTCSQLHQLSLESFAMLLPCGTDMFTGVEFVCCPKDMTGSVLLDATTVSVAEPKIEVKVNTNPDAEVVHKYLTMSKSPNADYENEHDVYELAKKQLLKDNHDKITKLMKEWSEVKNRLTEMKRSDPKQAEQLNSELTERYQKEYFALQSEGDSKLLQLDAVHQQHVQSSFNGKKKNVMQKLMSQLQAQIVDSENAFELLQKYVSIEEKDAQHCLKHFLKIRSRDPQAAKDLLPATIEHIELVSLRINQSIDLLDALKDKALVEKLKHSLRAWLEGTYVSLDNIVIQLRQISFSNIVTDRPTFMPPTTTQPPQPVVSTVGEESSVNTYKVYAQKLSETDFVRKADVEILAEELDKDDDNDDREENKVGSLQKTEVDAQVQSSMLGMANAPVASGISAGAAIAIACSLIGAMVVVIAAILMVKKKVRASGRRTHNYLQVSADATDLSPEDRHVVAMQHGYENPTYKLLEQKRA